MFPGYHNQQQQQQQQQQRRRRQQQKQQQQDTKMQRAGILDTSQSVIAFKLPMSNFLLFAVVGP
jgi:hypothetical protein